MIKSVKAKSNNQEKKLAKKIGATQVPASGAVRFGGYDLNHPLACIEAKYTDEIHYTLKFSDLEKIRKIALNKNKMPVLVIEFRQLGTAYAVVDTSSIIFAGAINSKIIDITTKTIKFSESTLRAETGAARVILNWVNESKGKLWHVMEFNSFNKEYLLPKPAEEVTKEVTTNGNTTTTTN
jgi:hypothetical protein